MSANLIHKNERVKHGNKILKTIVTVVNFNISFVVMTLLGFFSLIFEPSRINDLWYGENTEFIYSLITGIGISGVICWFFTFRTKVKSRWHFDLPYFLWLTCHLFTIITFLIFSIKLGLRKDGTFSGLALGVFFSLVLHSPFSILYTMLYSRIK